MRYINILTLILTAGAVIFTLLFLLSPSALGIVEGSSLYESKYFDSETVTVVNITISEENWEEILENPLAEEYHTADITINGDTYSAVGIRTKGMTSLSSVASSDSDRYSFKIKADEYVSGQNFAGLDEFVLNNNYQDPTYMKEYLSYELMEEMEVPTPLHTYAAVSINGEYWGLYLMVEAVEEDFAMRNFGSSYGELYKPETMDMGGDMTPGFDKEMPQMPENFSAPVFNENSRNPQNGFPMPENFSAPAFNENNRNPQNGSPMPEFTGGGFGGFGTGGGADLVYTDDDTESYSQIFDNAVFGSVSESDKKRVITALQHLSDGTDIDEYVDVDSVLRYFAANTALVSLDSYVSSLKHNYYLYEEGGVISILPWDYNLAFGTFQSGDAESVVNFPIDTPVSEGISLEERPLIGSLLEIPAYKEQYHTYLAYIAEEFFGESFSKRVDRIDSLIGDYVESDPTAFYSYAEYEEGLSALKIYAELRAESIRAQLNGTIPATHEGQKNSTVLVDAAELEMQSLGTMDFGGRGGK